MLAAFAQVVRLIRVLRVFKLGHGLSASNRLAHVAPKIGSFFSTRSLCCRLADHVEGRSRSGKLCRGVGQESQARSNMK